MELKVHRDQHVGSSKRPRTRRNMKGASEHHNLWCMQIVWGGMAEKKCHACSTHVLCLIQVFHSASATVGSGFSFLSHIYHSRTEWCMCGDAIWIAAAHDRQRFYFWSSEWEVELVVGNGWTASIERISILLIDCVISLNWHIDWSEKSVWIQICMESRCGRCWRLHRLHFGAFNELWWRFDSNQNFYLSVEDWFVDAKNEKVNLTSEKRFFTCGFLLFWPIFSCGSELSSKSSLTTMFANNNAMIE